MRDLRSLPPIGLSLYRIVIGFLMTCHGASTLTGFPVKPYGGHTLSLTEWPDGVAGLLQLAFGLLVMLGLATRPAAIVLSGTMAYAYFSVHQKHALLPMANGGEQAALFSWSFLLIAIIGAGPLALDALLARSRSQDEGHVARVARRLTSRNTPAAPGMD
ncbi:DoxX family protein [Catenulispora subtropica]|uniref:DoxX family protein n=1 Tax=Catenulispora subtropica TaxID=450798 RepID=A0ABP5DNP1_9ACTN